MAWRLLPQAITWTDDDSLLVWTMKKKPQSKFHVEENVYKIVACKIAVLYHSVNCWSTWDVRSFVVRLPGYHGNTGATKVTEYGTFGPGAYK